MHSTLPVPESEEKARGIILGKIVEAHRLQRGWTRQATLAEAAGTTQATISRLESGNLLRPDAFLFRSLAAAFDLAPDALHLKIDAVIGEVKAATESISTSRQEWWTRQSALALGGFALYATLTLVGHSGPRGDKRRTRRRAEK